jgi:hypothetical protein
MAHAQARQHLRIGVAQIAGQAPAPQPHPEPASYPPCDYCGTVPSYHPWHGSGMLNGLENRHIHACEGCREKLPTHPGRPHPEPIAWMVGTAIWWTKEEAERDAAATGLPIVGLGPMTDAGEVERLRTERKRMDEALVACADERDELRKANTEFEAQVASDFKFIDDLRAQLGGAHSLLREADEFMYIMTAHDGHAKLAHRYGKDWWDAIDKLRGKVCTALSASAGPSAPVERDALAKSGKCLDGGDCGVGGICKWCPHTRAALERKPS